MQYTHEGNDVLLKYEEILGKVFFSKGKQLRVTEVSG